MRYLHQVAGLKVWQLAGGTGWSQVGDQPWATSTGAKWEQPYLFEYNGRLYAAASKKPGSYWRPTIYRYNDGTDQWDEIAGITDDNYALYSSFSANDQYFGFLSAVYHEGDVYLFYLKRLTAYVGVLKFTGGIGSESLTFVGDFLTTTSISFFNSLVSHRGYLYAYIKDDTSSTLGDNYLGQIFKINPKAFGYVTATTGMDTAADGSTTGVVGGHAQGLISYKGELYAADGFSVFRYDEDADNWQHELDYTQRLAIGTTTTPGSGNMMIDAASNWDYTWYQTRKLIVKITTDNGGHGHQNQRWRVSSLGNGGSGKVYVNLISSASFGADLPAGETVELYVRHGDGQEDYQDGCNNFVVNRDKLYVWGGSYGGGEISIYRKTIDSFGETWEEITPPEDGLGNPIIPHVATLINVPVPENNTLGLSDELYLLVQIRGDSAFKTYRLEQDHPSGEYWVEDDDFTGSGNIPKHAVAAWNVGEPQIILDRDGAPDGTTKAANGIVIVPYRAYDSDSETISFTMEYSTDQGLTWQVCTDAGGSSDGTTAVSTSPTGVLHTFLWSAETDLGTNSFGPLMIRATDIRND